MASGVVEGVSNVPEGEKGVLIGGALGAASNRPCKKSTVSKSPTSLARFMTAGIQSVSSSKILSRSFSNIDIDSTSLATVACAIYCSS